MADKYIETVTSAPLVRLTEQVGRLEEANTALQRKVRRFERVVLVSALLFVLLLVWVLVADGGSPLSAALGVVVFFTPTFVIGLLLLTTVGILWGRWKSSREKRRVTRLREREAQDAKDWVMRRGVYAPAKKEVTGEGGKN